MANILAIGVITGKGGKEFKRELDAFCDHWQAKGDNIEIVKMPKSTPYNMRKNVLNALELDDKPIDKLVFFCHGTPKKLKCGFHIWNVGDLAQALKPRVKKKLHIALYACSCGRGRFEWPWRLVGKRWLTGQVLGKNGFAARFADELTMAGMDCTIFCHGSKGHTTWNPYCYSVEPNVARDAIYRMPIVARGTPEWAAWKAELKTDRRFEVPFE